MYNDNFTLKIKYVLTGILLILVQVGFGDNMRLFGVAPNLILCYVLTASFKIRSSFGFYNALCFGILLDSFSGRIFGAYTIFFVIFDILIEKLFYRHFSEHFFFEFLSGASLCFVFSLFYAITVWLFEGDFIFLFFRICIVETIINSIVFLFFLLISKRKKKRRRSAFRV